MTDQRCGESGYTEVLGLLAARGLPARWTTTGGRCAALEARLEGGALLLVTDAEGSLCWQRAEHRGWGVGLYAGDDEELVAYESTKDGGAESLPALVDQVLAAGRGASA